MATDEHRVTRPGGLEFLGHPDGGDVGVHLPILTVGDGVLGNYEVGGCGRLGLFKNSSTC